MIFAGPTRWATALNEVESLRMVDVLPEDLKPMRIEVALLPVLQSADMLLRALIIVCRMGFPIPAGRALRRFGLTGI